jgi:hypothetical protein
VTEELFFTNRKKLVFCSRQKIIRLQASRGMGGFNHEVHNSTRIEKVASYL